jgi:transcriptional regulator with XRE-family HTH domain
MNPIEQLQSYVSSIRPGAVANISAPLHTGGVWSLDVDFGERSLSIEWSPTTGFGVSNVSDENFGERHDETFASLEKIKGRIRELLTTDARTTPPFGVLLSRLRENAGLTQQQMASKLGVRQATLSGIENRKDIQLSTLQRAVEVLGGYLEIFAVISNARYRISVGGRGYQRVEEMPRGTEGATKVEPIVLQETVFVALHSASALRWASERAQSIRDRGTLLEIPC